MMKTNVNGYMSWLPKNGEFCCKEDMYYLPFKALSIDDIIVWFVRTQTLTEKYILKICNVIMESDCLSFIVTDCLSFIVTAVIKRSN